MSRLLRPGGEMPVFETDVICQTESTALMEGVQNNRRVALSRRATAEVAEIFIKYAEVMPTAQLSRSTVPPLLKACPLKRMSTAP